MNEKKHSASALKQKRAAERRRRVWVQVALVGLGASLLLALVVYAVGQGGTQSVALAQVGAPLSNFTLTDIHGQKVKLADYQGQVVLVNAWATWCPPCRAEMPDLNTYYQQHQADGFIILAINAGDPQSSAAEFAQSNALAFPVLLDANLNVLNGFGIHNFPTSLVLGRDGRVRTIHVGMYTPEALAADIAPLLSE